MRNYLHDEDSQDIYLEVAILVTDEKQAPRQALLEVRPTESESLATDSLQSWSCVIKNT
jgi:hypothetical protein